MLVGRKSLRRQGSGGALLRLIRTRVCSQMGLCDIALSQAIRTWLHHKRLLTTDKERRLIFKLIFATSFPPPSLPSSLWAPRPASCLDELELG